MIRATTPTHTFLFPSDPEEYSKILITYAQGKNIILEKNESDLVFETTIDNQTGDVEYAAYLTLSQEETNLFRTYYGSTVTVQVRVLDEDGIAYASEKKVLPLYDVLNDEILTDSEGTSGG